MKELENDKVSKMVEICQLIKLFGKCSEFNCPKRHVLSKNLDVYDVLPKSGYLRFKIVDIFDLTHFSIQLIEHIDNQNEVTAYNIKEITEELTDTLKINKKRMSNAILGHYYTYYCSETELFHRCRLLERENENVKIVLIDRGKIVNTITSKVFQLPQEFSVKHYPEKSKYIYIFIRFQTYIKYERSILDYPIESCSIYRVSLYRLQETNIFFKILFY